MKNFFTLSLCFLALSLSAQETITYPYNPDGDADGLVAVPDIQDLLAVYGSPFSPAEIMVGDTALSEWIQILYQALQDQQAVIEAMQGAGRCDVRFPDGLDGEYFTTLLRDADMNDYPYTVPFGKTLYVTSVYTGHHVLITNDTGEASKIISGSNGGVSSTEYKSLHNPIILHEGQTISGYGNPGTLASMNGFLVNAGVEPITWNGGTYQVPLGKTLYVTNIRGSLYLYLENDDEFILLADGAGNNHTIGAPIVFNSDQIVHVFGGNTNDGGTVNGYLVDEDYFADCGGGGSSDGYIENGDLITTIDSLNQVVSNLDSLMQIIIPFFGCTDPTACNYDSMALIDNSSCSGLLGCTDFLSSNYNSSATCDDGSCIPYVGMYGYGGIVYKLENGSAYVINITDELSAGNSAFPVYDAINDLNNSTGSKGYFDWQVPGVGDWESICENLALINILAYQNNGMQLNGLYINNNYCYSQGNTNFMCCVNVSDGCGFYTGGNTYSSCPNALIRPIRYFTY